MTNRLGRFTLPALHDEDKLSLAKSVYAIVVPLTVDATSVEFRITALSERFRPLLPGEPIPVYRVTMTDGNVEFEEQVDA